MTSRPRVLIISEVVPRQGDAGGMVLARHFKDYPDVLAIDPFNSRDVTCATARVDSTRLWRIAGRSPNSRIARLIALGGCIRPLRVSVAARVLTTFRPNVLVAVAHGEMAFVAARLARHTRLPLALIFHDWWPDFVPTRFRQILDYRYRRLFRESSVAFCVSDSFRQMLGRHARAIVLPPLSDPAPGVSSGEAVPSTFQLHYHGNMTGCYRAPMVSLLRSLNGVPWRLTLTGCLDDWSTEEKALASRAGGFRGYLPQHEFDSLRLTASAFLVVLSFFQGDRRRVQTSFPCKLVEYCQYRRPIIIWGPANSAAAVWSRETGAALLVDRPEPAALVQAVERLAHDHQLCQVLTAGARRQAETRFSPSHIRHVFDSALAELSSSVSRVQ